MLSDGESTKFKATCGLVGKSWTLQCDVEIRKEVYTESLRALLLE